MKKKNKLFSKKFIVKNLIVLFTLSFIWAIYLLRIQSPLEDVASFRIERGATISSVANELEERGLIESEYLFKVSAILTGGRVQIGEYDLPRGASVWRIAKMFNRGDVASTLVMIPEGFTVKQIKNLLNEDTNLTGAIECVSEKERPVCNLKEGDLFPDTYRVARGTGRLAILELSRKKMADIKIGWENSGKAMPSPLKSWNEVITLASIVQKETPKVSEMPIVASVYLNRLHKKMKLQADPTVVYAITDGLGNMQGAGLFSGHLKTKSPYNTYVNYGLPPAPIANVGRAAIAAVLNPADTNYLFFVADGQGGHNFAKSYEEHQKNHANWRELKKQMNAGKKTGDEKPSTD